MTGQQVTRSRAAAWRNHLRAGGTTPWLAFDGAPEPEDGWVPGAQQLELLRRVNQLGAPPAGVADRILGAPLPFRGMPDLDLAGTLSGEHGPEPVDPSRLPPAELVRVAVAVLTDVAVARTARGCGPDPQRGRHRLLGRARRLLRTPVTLAGPPAVTRAVRRQLVADGAVVGHGGDVVVVGAPLDRMLADAWWRRVVTHGAPPWPRWLREVVARDQLPAPADLAVLARRWEERRPGRVVVAATPADAFARAGGHGALDVPARNGPHAELERRVGMLLGVRVSPAQRTRLLARGVLPDGVHDVAQVPLALTPQAHAWALDRAERLADEIRRGGYPVVGDPELLRPAGAPVEHVGRLIGRGVLPLAVAALHASEPALESMVGEGE